MASDRRLSWARVLGIWTLVGFGLVVMMFISLSNEPGQLDLKGTLFTILAQMYRGWIWALLTPFVFQFRREIRRRHSSWLAVGFLHLLASVTLFFWCNIMRIWAINITFGFWSLDMFTVDHVFSVFSHFTIAD